MASLDGQIFGKYRIESRLGSGGMGAVYKAYDTSLQRPVAIKVMHDHIGQQDEFRARFQQEAIAAAQLNHPGIVKVHAIEEHQEMLFIVMEFIPGDNLDHLLTRMSSQSRWIVLPEAIKLICQIGAALEYAHRIGVVHRDIKPSNIMLRPAFAEAEGLQPVITDLGLAKLLEGANLTNTGMGTPGYMSPEQAQAKPTDRRSDIYSVGILLYHLTVGRLPFIVKRYSEGVLAHVNEQPQSPRLLNPTLPPAVEKIILRALEKNPDDRFSTMRDFVQALKAIHPADLLTSVPPSATAGSHPIFVADITPIPSAPPIPQEHALPPTVEMIAADGTRRSVAMQGTTLTIGRNDDNDLVINDENISRYHARVTFDGTQARIIDLDSTNGTKLEGVALLANIAEVWRPTATLRISGYTLRLLPTVPGRVVPPVGDGAKASSNKPLQDAGPTRAADEGLLTTPDTTPATTPSATTTAATTVAASPRRGGWTLIISLLIPLVLVALLALLWQRGALGSDPLATAIAWVMPPEATPAATPTGEESSADGEGGRIPLNDDSTPIATIPPSAEPDEEDLPIVPIGPLPDLAIARMAVAPDRDECGNDAALGLEVIIINKGDGIAGEYIIEVNDHQLRVEAGLEPGQTVRVWLPDFEASNMVILDGADVVREYHEDNNTMEIASGAPVIPTCVPTPTDTPEPPTDTPDPPTDTPQPPTDTPRPPSDTPRPPTDTPEPPTDTPRPPVAVPNDNPLQFVYVRGGVGETDIYLYDMESQTVVPVATNSGCDEAEPRWTPSGDAILYHADCNGSYDIYRYHVPSGNTERLTQTDQYDEWEPSLHPDGTSLTYRRTPASNRRHVDDAPIWIHNLRTQQVVQVGVSGRSPSWSPDGELLLLMSQRDGSWQVYTYDRDTDRLTLISTNCRDQCRWPAWFPDGQAVAYAASDGVTADGIWFAFLDEDEPFLWMGGTAGRSSWSITGKVVFGTEDGIEISETDGSGREMVIASSTNWAPAWNK